MIAKQDVAAAVGVAANQVLKPASPTTDECVWAIASRAGAPGEQVALTLQVVDRVKQTHGFMQRLATVMSAAGAIPGLPLANPLIAQAFSDAQLISGIGDRAGWKDGVLSVLRDRLLFNIRISGSGPNEQRLADAETLARDVVARLESTPQHP